MVTGQSPIFVKVETFMVWLLRHTARFPRHERFRLAHRIDDALFSLHGCLLRAARTAIPGDHLREADIHLHQLRTYLRLSVELTYTTPKQYQYAARQTTEIGKLLGGWLKTLEQ